MKSNPGWAAIGLAAMLAVSACLGADPKPAEVSPGATVPPTEELSADTTCGVWGTVTDEEYAPLADVRVVLSTSDGPLLEYVTGADGKYAFSGLEVGTYKIQAHRSGLNQEGESVLLKCLAGDVAEIPIVLVSSPNPRAPYAWSPVPKRGRIGCSVRVLLVVLGDPCELVDPSASSSVTFLPPAGNATGVILEIDWQPQTAVVGGDWLSIQFPKPPDGTWARETNAADAAEDEAGLLTITGPPPLRFRMEGIDVTQDFLMVDDGAEWAVTASVPHQGVGFCFSYPEECQPVEVAVDLSFDVYLSFYYWGMATPSLADYSNLPP